MSDKPWEPKWERRVPIPGGAQGFTYYAKEREGSRSAVLKILRRNEDKTARQRMNLEVLHQEKLHAFGANVPEVWDHNTQDYKDADARLYFVMECIPGKNLADLLKERGKPFSLSESLYIVESTLKTISIAHKNGILHRDIKPENLIPRAGRLTDIVVIDLGISFNKQESDHPTLASDGFGNKFLFLPELTPGEDHSQYATDIAYLGGILYYCLTGYPPSQLEDPHGNKPHRRSGKDLANIEATGIQKDLLNLLLDNAFERNPANRIASAEGFQSQLVKIREATPGAIRNRNWSTLGKYADEQMTSRDRGTQLAIFGRHINGIYRCITDRAKEIISQMPQFSFSSGGLTNSKPLPPMEDKIPLHIVFEIHHRLNSSYRFSMTYHMTSAGNKCTIYRGNSQSYQNKSSSSNWVPVCTFSGHSEPPYAVIIADLEDAIEAIMHSFSSGKPMENEAR